MIADALARSRIASFRYDKRGCGKSGGAYKTAGFHDLIDDAAAALDTLLAHARTSRVVLLGHSEGTLIAPVLAARRSEVSGLILLCPTVAPVEATLNAQAAQLAEELRGLPGLSGIIARSYFALRGGVVHAQERLVQRVKASTEATLRAGGSRVPARWLRELLAHDPEAAIRRVSVPMLCVSGEKDLQCDPRDGHRIAAIAKGPVEVHVIPDLTHILRRDGQTPSIARYRALLGLPVDPALTELVRDWVLRQEVGATRP